MYILQYYIYDFSKYIYGVLKERYASIFPNQNYSHQAHMQRDP